MRHEGTAQPGDWYVTPWGEHREVLAVWNAGVWIESVIEYQITSAKAGAPNYMRDSIAGLCALYGGALSADLRARERERKRLRLPVRKGAAHHGRTT
jgi:hypothetical protein